MWLGWDKLAPEDQAYVSNWYKTNRLDPFLSQDLGLGSSMSRGFGEGQETSDSAKAFDPRYVAVNRLVNGEYETTYRDATDQDYGYLLRGTDPSIITGEGRLLGKAGQPLKKDATKFANGTYNQTQVGLLNSIAPDIAQKYGITDQSANSADMRNWSMQADRYNTHQLNSGRENAAIEAVLLTIAGGAVGAGVGAATGSTVAGGVASGAATGAASAQMNDQNVAKGAGRGAVIGGVTAGLGSAASGASGSTGGIYNSGYTTGSTLGDTMAQGAIRGGASSGLQGGDVWKGALAGGATAGAGDYINSNNLFGNDLMNRFATGATNNAISSYANGRPMTWQGLLSAGGSSAAGGLTDNKLVNQAVGGLLNYALADRNQGGQTADPMQAKRAAAKKAYYDKMKGNGNG